MRLIAALTFFAAAMLGFAGDSAAQDGFRGYPFDNCRGRIHQVIDELGVPRDEIEFVNVVEKYGGMFGNVGSEDPRLVGWTGWVRPVGIKGYLVIEVNLSCGLRQVYTRGDYRLDGVKHF